MKHYAPGTILELQVERDPYHHTSSTSKMKKKRVIVDREEGGVCFVHDVTKTLRFAGTKAKFARPYRLNDEMLWSGVPASARWFVHGIKAVGGTAGGKKRHARKKCGNVNTHEGLVCTRHAGHKGLHVGSMKGHLVQWRTGGLWFEGVEQYDRGHELQKRKDWKLRQKTHTSSCDDCGQSVRPETRECPSCGSRNIVSKDEIAVQTAELRRALRK